MSTFYAESVLFQSPDPSQLPPPIFEKKVMSTVDAESASFQSPDPSQLPLPIFENNPKSKVDSPDKTIVTTNTTLPEKNSITTNHQYKSNSCQHNDVATTKKAETCYITVQCKDVMWESVRTNP